MRTTHALPLVGGGFLLSVLWFDLKFDVLVLEAWTRGTAIDEAALAAMQAYYVQALGTESSGFPLISSMMGMSVASLAWQFREVGARWKRLCVSMLLLVPPIALAGVRIVPNARALAQSTGPIAEQSALAISILTDHLYCFASIAAFLVFELFRLRSVDHEPS